MFLFAILMCVPLTTNAENKTKRTLSHELYNYGETNPVLIYRDPSAGSYTSNGIPLTVVGIPQTIKVYEQIIPKTPSPPNIYEYQQTPTNVEQAKPSFLYPNKNLNSYLPNSNSQQQRYQEPISPTTTFHNFVPSETVIVPVQNRPAPPIYENTVPPPLNFRPLPFHNNQHVPRKYFYPNGRTVFDPSPNPYVNQNINPPQTSTDALLPNQNYYQIQQRTGRLPVVDNINRNLPFRQNLIPSANISPNTYNKFIATQKVQPPPVTFSPKVTLKKDKEDKKKTEDLTEIKDNEEDETNSEENFNEDDSEHEHEQDPSFSKYSFDYEENEEHDRNPSGTDNDEEDITKESTKYGAPKKHKKKNFKYVKSSDSSTDKDKDIENKYGSSEGKYNEKNNKKPKMFYRAVKYSREINNNPKVDLLEGRHSEHLPVTHKHRIFKEKWYITKNTDDNIEAK